MKTTTALKRLTSLWGVIAWGAAILWAVLILVQDAAADSLSAGQLGDFGNVTVMEVSGNFNVLLPDGSQNVAARQVIAREFFRTHKDEYDTVVIFTNFDYEMPPDAVAFYGGVKNDVRGIGQQIYDNGDLYGSNGRLYGTIDMGNLKKMASNPLEPAFNFSIDTLIHESLHRWAAQLRFRDWNGTASEALLGQDKSHWSFLLDSGGSTMYGNKWRVNGDGTFTSTAIRKYFSPLDLYVMGIIDKSQVPPTLLIDNPAIDPARMPGIGDTVSGTARYVAIDDIIAVEGERIPDARDSQKQFKTAFIYAVSPDSFSSDDLYGLENIRNGFLTRFSILTDGKGLVQVVPTPKDSLPVNPGVRPPSTVPRILPPTIDSGVAWLTSHQQADGSWADYLLTTERDTAEAVSILWRFPSAASAYQAGSAWLEGRSSANTDYLARRIESAAQSGTAGTLVQELAARRNRDGGWGSSRNYTSSPTDTALALKALAVAGYADTTVTGPAIAYLQGVQNSDGGWSGDDAVSTIQPTAAVLTAFSLYRKNVPLEASLIRAQTYLAMKQNSDGGFGNSPSTVYDTAVAVTALQGSGGDKAVYGRGLDYLLGQQSDDGSWSASPYQTAMAVRAVWTATIDPDLAIKSSDIAMIPATVTALPTNAVLSATVWNLGHADVPQAKVAVYDGVVSLDRKVAEQTAAFPGQSPVTLTFAIPVTDSTGHLFHVVVDPDNQISESNKSNNGAATSLMPEVTYDFQVQPSDILIVPNPVDRGKDFNVTFTVYNSGTSDAFDVPVRIYLSQSGTPVEVARVGVDVQAGGSVTKEVVCRAGVAGTNLPLTIQVDPDNDFSETSKDNNTASVPLTVHQSTLPNLTVSYRDMNITPSPVLERGSATISALVRNDGFGPADNVKVAIYQGLATNNGVLLGNQVISAIAAGQSASISIEWTGIPVSGGQIIAVQIDPETTIQETSKDDNFAFINLDVSSLPDLAISTNSIAVAPAAPRSGDQVLIAVTVQNSGDQDARDIPIQLREGDAVIGSGVIPQVHGNSQAVATISYLNAGQAGIHRISVVVDPDNLIQERVKGNNSALKIFSIQDANIWLTEPYISPNGDGVKDSTDFSFRLAAPTKVCVQIVNKFGVIVRNFCGDELDNTAGSSITWDGRNDAGSVVDDGTYQIKVVSAAGIALAGLPVEVDTNRSPFAEAIGTRFLLQNNLTCNVPAPITQWNWLPHDSGVTFTQPYNLSDFASGFYQMSPVGDDVHKVTPDDWFDTEYDYVVETDTAALSSDGTKLAFVVWKYERSTNRYLGGIWEQALDGSGRRELNGGMDLNIGKLKWSPDSRQIVYVYGPLSYWGFWAYELRTINAGTGAMAIVDEGYPYWDHEGVAWSPDSASLAYPINTHCNADKSYCHQDYETLKVSRIGSETRSVFNSTGNMYSFENLTWLADGQLLAEEIPRYGDRRLVRFDTVTQGAPTIIQDGADYPSDRAIYAVNPDLGSVAYVSRGSGGGQFVLTVNVTDMAGHTSVLGGALNAAISGGVPVAPIWKLDGNMLAFVEREARVSEEVLLENLIVYDRTTALSRKFPMTSVPLSVDYSGMNEPPKINRLIAWLSDKVSVLVQSSDGYFAINTQNGEKSAMLPVTKEWGDPMVSLSPDQRYLTYLQNVSTDGVCKGTEGRDIWTITSLLNLTADLRILKFKSFVMLRGTASDKNFDGYRLEYADTTSPEAWNLITPPSDVPVPNAEFTTWIPPYEGVFLVRLTVSDKAGNQASDRKRVSWGASTLVGGLYRDNEYIAPKNPDNPKRTVTVRYAALDSVHLEFSVVNDLGMTVRNYSREHTGYAVDSITWDGRDEAGDFVPDGTYAIKLFDYVFKVEVDNSPPDVALDFGRVTTDLSKLGSQDYKLYLKTIYGAILAAMMGHVHDKNLKKWLIEYGEGDNPSDWHEYLRGEANVAQTNEAGIIAYPAQSAVFKLIEFSDLYYLTGKKFRITAEDFAGNKRSAVSNYLQDQIVVQASWGGTAPGMANKTELLEIKYRGFASYWHYLDQQVLNDGDSREFVFFVNRSAMLDGIGYERLRNPAVRHALQCYAGDRWKDSSAPVTVDNGFLSVTFPDSTERKSCTATRFKSTDVTGAEYLSNTYVMGADSDVIDGGIGDGDSDGGGGGGSGGAKDGASTPAFTVIYPESRVCGELSGEIQLPTEQLPLSGVKKIAYFVSVGAVLRPLGEVDVEHEGPRRVIVATGLFTAGNHPLSVLFTYLDGTKKQTDLGKVAVFDREAPIASLTLPVSPCPVITATPKGNRTGINIHGSVSDNNRLARYAVSYGIGENPSAWIPATAGNNQQISGTEAVTGLLGVWDITDIPGALFSLKLEVIDAAGNKGCAVGSVTVDRDIAIKGFSVSPALFSPNNDGILDTLTSGFTIDETATIDVSAATRVKDANGALAPGAVVRHLQSGLITSGGKIVSDWDGRGDSGVTSPSAHYAIVVNARDACGNTATTWTEAELDSTPPRVAITYPVPGDALPQGIMIEVRGTASDDHFKSFQLEAGEGINPAAWKTLAASDKPVDTAVITSWNTFGLNGVWTLRLTAEDTVGNRNAASSTIDLGVRKELVKSFAADPKLISPNNDQIMDSATISFEVADESNITLDILDTADQVVRSFTSASTGANKGSFVWDGRSVTGAVVPDGSCKLRLTASQTANPHISQVETISFVVDASPPAITISEPVDKAVVNRTELALSGSILDANLDGYTILFGRSGMMNQQDSGTQNRLNHTFGRLTELAEDTYLLVVEAKDHGQNQSQLTRTVTIDRTPPRVSVDAPRSGEFFGNSRATIDIAGFIVEKNLERYSLRHGVGESPTEWKELAGGDTVPTAAGLASLNAGITGGLADGIHTLSLYARDKAGLESEAKVKLVVDNTPPTIVVASPHNGAYVTKGMEIRGTLVDDNLDKATVELARGACGSAINWAIMKNLNSSVPDGIIDSWTALPADGEYCLRLAAVDKIGNRSETKTGFRVDTHPPAAPQLTGKVDNKTEVLLSWTKNAELDLAGYNIYRDNRRLNTTLLSDLTYRDGGLAEGSYRYAVKAVDLAGNESNASNSATVKIDFTAPTVRIASPGDGAAISSLIDIKGTAFSQDDFKEYRVYIGQGNTPSTWTQIRRSPLPVSFGTLAQWDTITSLDGGQYSLKLVAEDTSGNVASTQLVVTIDNAAPKAPVLLSALANSSDVALSWQANAEPDLAGYLLYRNDQLVNATVGAAGSLKQYLVAGTGYADTSLPDGSYSYFLVAMDLAGNISDQSDTLTVSIDTHPPHMTLTEPANGHRFDGKLLLKAETPDNDIAMVQFQYKRSQDTAWTNLGARLTRLPYSAYFDPKGLGLSYGEYQLQVAVTDLGGNVDPAPVMVTVTYADLTPPDVPSGLAAQVNGAEVKLTWSAVNEADVAYTIYRASNGNRSSVNSVPVKDTAYVDAGVPDGIYQYEVTAIDATGNESKGSSQVAARVYAPVLVQPFTPVKASMLTLAGSGVAPGAQVQVSRTIPAGETSTLIVTADPAGDFKLEGIVLGIGENRFTANASDSLGNVSRTSDTIVVMHDVPPTAPTGVTPFVQNFDVQLTWVPNIEPVIGYYVYRDGIKRNIIAAIADGQVSASVEDYYAPAINALDGNDSTAWSTPYGYGTFTPAWLEVTLPAPELISSVTITWGQGNWDYTNNRPSLLAGKDYELQAWSGYTWIAIKKITGNDQQLNDIAISPSYRTARLRIAVASTTDPEDSNYVRINEVGIAREVLLSETTFTDPGLWDHLFTYTVSAVGRYGFEGEQSMPVSVPVGDVMPPAAPTNLTVSVNGPDAVLDWYATHNTEPDLAGFAIYRQSGHGWALVTSVPSTATGYSDFSLANGTYQYRITAYDLVGNESAPSNEVNASIAVAPPVNPTLLQLTAPSEGKELIASWQGSTDTTISYNVYRSLVSGTGFVRVNNAPVQQVSYRDASLANGTTYFYVVTAVDRLGNESIFSNELSGVPRKTTMPARPEIFAPVAAGEQLVVYHNGVEVAGGAEPGAEVMLIAGDNIVGTAVSLAEDNKATKQFNVENYTSPVLSPRGSMLTFIHNNGALMLTHLDGGPAAPLFNGDGYGWDAVWAPDETRIAFSRHDASWNYRLAVYDVATATSSFLTDDEYTYEYAPSWSSDGNKIAFMSTRNGNNGLWVKDLAANSLVEVADMLNSSALAMSPDATKIAYFIEQNLFVINVPDGTTSQLDDNTDRVSVTWNSDSSKVAFISYRDGEPALFVTDLKTRVTSKVAASASGCYLPVWSPDSTRIACVQNDGGFLSLRLHGLNGQQSVLQDNLNGYSALYWAKSGAIIFGDSDTAHTFRLKGTFNIPDVQLVAGENRIAAIATDDSSNASLPSDDIVVIYDTRMAADLAVSESDITLFPPIPKPGDEVLVTARIRNVANAAAQNVKVELYRWDGSNDITMLDSTNITLIGANGEGEVGARFNAGTESGRQIIIVVVDPERLLDEVSESNNYAAREYVVTTQETVMLETSLNSEHYSANNDLAVNVAIRNSGLPKNGTLTVAIEDAAGVRVKLIDSRLLEVGYGYNEKLPFVWNTAATFAGNYRLHAVLSDGVTVLSEAVSPFTIVPDRRVNAGIVTDRQQYYSSQDVGLILSVKNTGVNYRIPGLTAKLKISGPRGTSVYAEDQAVGSLMPGASAIQPFVWNTGLAAPGQYTAALELYEGEGRLVSTSAEFSIAQTIRVGGTIKADPAVVQSGDNVTVNWALSDSGNADAAGTVSLSLVDPDTMAVIAAVDEPATVSMGGTIAGTATLPGAGLKLKSYRISLSFSSVAGTIPVASTMISVRDGAPPAVRVATPANGVTYAKSLDISVFATDTASGVDKVEYNIDDGAWLPLPLADAATGRYAITWLPPPTLYGTHVAGFRAADRAGTTSQPVTVNFTIRDDTDVKPPILTVTVAGSGSGTVTSSPQTGGSISCQTGFSANCSASFPITQAVDLTATRSFGSIFGGWSGDCGGITATCSISAMTADKGVTATFTVTPPAFIYSATPVPSDYFSILLDAHAAAPDGATILMQASIPTGGTLTGSNKTVTLKGGYDADYTPDPPETSVTTVQGPLAVRAGRVNVQRVKVK